MSRVFINAKTEMICDTISAALADAGAEITCCFDNEQAAAADLSGYDVVIVSTPLRSEFGLNYVAEIHDRTSAVIIVLAKTEIADEVQNRIKFTGAYVLPRPFTKQALVLLYQMPCITHPLQLPFRHGLYKTLNNYRRAFYATPFSFPAQNP